MITQHIGKLCAVVTCATLVALFPQSAHGGGWMSEEGSWQLSYSTIFTSFDRVKLHDGSTGRPGAVHYVSNALTIEHVPIENLLLSLTVPYEESSRDGVDATTPGFDARKPENGLGDGVLSIRYRLLDEFVEDSITASVQASIRTPLSNYDEHKLHAFGDGQTDLELRGQLGRFFTLFDRDHYVAVEGGYRWRLEDPANEVVLYAEVGGDVSEHFSARVFAEYVDSLGGLGLESPRFGAIAAADGKPPFPRVQEDYTNVGVGFSYVLGDNLDVSVFGARTVEAKNTSVDEVYGVIFGMSL